MMEISFESWRYWIAVVFKENGDFDCILNDAGYKTWQDCQNAIEKAKEQDKKWGIQYVYSKPQNIGILP